MRLLMLGLPFLMMFTATACDQNRTPQQEKAEAHAQKAFQEFRASMKYTLEAADQKLKTLREKAQKATGKTREELDEEIEQLQGYRKKAQHKLEKLGDTFSENWEQMRAEVQDAVTDLNEAADAAWKKLKD